MLRTLLQIIQSQHFFTYKFGKDLAPQILIRIIFYNSNDMMIKNPECEFQLQDLVFAKCLKSKPWPAQVINIFRGRPEGIRVEQYIYKVNFFGHPSTSVHRSVQLEKFNDDNIKKYREMYYGSTDGQQLAILKSIVIAQNKKTQMQPLVLPVKAEQVQLIENKKQSAQKRKQDLEQKQIRAKYQQEKIMRKKTPQKLKQIKLIQQIYAKKQKQIATQIIKTNIHNKITTNTNTKPILKIQENAPITQQDKLPPNHTQPSQPHPRHKVSTNKATIQRIPPKFGIKTLSFNNRRKSATQGNCTFRLQYKPQPITIRQKNKQTAQGMQLFQNQVNMLESRKYIKFVYQKYRQLDFVQSFELAQLSKVQIEYNNGLEQNLADLQFDVIPKKVAKIQIPRLDKNYLKVTKKISKNKKKQKKRKGKKQKISIRLKSQILSTQAPPTVNIGPKQNEYLSLLNCNPEQQKLIAKYEVRGLTLYVIKILETLRRQLKVKDLKPMELAFLRKQRLTTIFGKKQLTVEMMLTSGILQLIVQFLKQYEGSQVAIKKELQIQYHFLQTKMSVYKKILLEKCTKIRMCKSKKIWLYKLLKQQKSVKKK